MNTRLFKTFTKPLLGLPVSHIWRGAGSAIFLEFGELQDVGRYRDNSPAEPEGQFGIMIEWSWRIEGKRKIICGSWSDERLWNRGFDLLLGSNVIQINCFGRLPEISVECSRGAKLVSFMTADGDPAWAIFDRMRPKSKTLISINGTTHLER